MAENDQYNDEYKFEGFDSPGSDSMGELEPDSSGGGSGKGPGSEKTNVIRNVLIVVGIIVFAMVLYKLVGHFMSGKTNQTPKQTITPISQISTQPKVTETPATVKPQVVEQPHPVAAINNQVENELKQKVSALELSQDSLKAQVNILSTQMNVVNTNIDSLNAQMTKMNQLIENLSNQLAQQAIEMKKFALKTQPKQVNRIVKKYERPVVYYIQAVIPGRAWLIATNGSTLTVREGSKIQGYGVVKLIDSLQGRVLTSSGRVIKFSQEDS